MALRGDSYGTVAEVLAYARQLRDGQSSFNSTSRPTLTEVEKFVDRASGILNVALNNEGLTTPISNSTAKLACDDWVISKATAYVELTQPASSYDGTEQTRAGSFLNLHKSAMEFADLNALGFKRLGVGVSYPVSDGLQFTGLDAADERADPDDSDLAQPMFTRKKWDND